MQTFGYRHGGWRQKYILQKPDGTPVNPDNTYFVLCLNKDPHARAAATTYAVSVMPENPKLASDIFNKLEETRDQFREVHKEDSWGKK